MTLSNIQFPTSLRHDSPVITTVVTKSFLPLYENWKAALDRVGIDNIFVVALDPETSEHLRDTNVSSILLPVTERTEVLQLKTQIVFELHKNRFDVLFSDVDAIWRKDCREIFYSDKTKTYDLIFSQAFGLPKSIVKLQGFSLCTGFYFIRKESALSDFFHEWLAIQHAHPEFCDQLSLNALIVQHPPKWNIKAEQLLTSEQAFYNENKKRDEFRYVSSPDFIDTKINISKNCSPTLGVLPFSDFRRGQSPATDDPYMVHIGSGGNVGEKIDEIKRNRPPLWFIS